MRVKKILYAIMIVLLLIVIWQLTNPIVEAANTVSRWITKEQIQKAEELGVIKRTNNEVRGNKLEVVNNYGEQRTIDGSYLQP